MKHCTNCQAELNDDVLFCRKCGTKQPETKPEPEMVFCEKCGNALRPEALFCDMCGARTCATSDDAQTSSNAYRTAWSEKQIRVHPILQELSKREKITSIMGIIMASLQALLVLICIIEITSYYYFIDTTSAWLNTLFLAAISAINFIGSFKSLKFSKKILYSPVGIQEKYAKANMFIGAIIWNGVLFIYNCAILSVWGMIIMAYALIVSILDTVWVRNFAIRNQGELNSLEGSAK